MVSKKEQKKKKAASVKKSHTGIKKSHPFGKAATFLDIILSFHYRHTGGYLFHVSHVMNL